MRIEVEVYKGPLSEEPEVQWGKLRGYLDEILPILVGQANFILAVFASEGFDNISESLQPIALKEIVGEVDTDIPPQYLYIPGKYENRVALTHASTRFSGNEIYWSPTWCEFKPLLPFLTVFEQIDFFDCNILRDLYLDSLSLIGVVSSFLKHHHEEIHAKTVDHQTLSNLLQEISALGSRLTERGFGWAVRSTPGQSMNVKVRIAVVNFVVTMTEFGNQVTTRADSLLKQRYPDGRDRRELSLSAHLRDTEPTDFVHLYNWLDASISSFRYELPSWIFSGFWPNKIEDRIRVVDRLFSDHYWSKINTVYASGRGKVSLVLVKDGIGNWNLKNFDNSPGELLQAYQNFSLSLLKKAGDIAGTYFTGGASIGLSEIKKKAPVIMGEVKEYLNVAKESTSFAQAAPTTESIAQARLETLKINAVAKIQSENQQRHDAEKPLIDLGNTTDLSTHRKQTLNLFKGILTDYLEQINLFDQALQKATAPSAPQPISTNPSSTSPPLPSGEEASQDKDQASLPVPKLELEPQSNPPEK
ncbi:MAG: hypothetical protein KC643_28815 [Nitrospira sp.]|nr:hypothetical protein [Nitrospira sp.]MCA9469422.1 hypothetical protein [Nitrospira sp.]